MAARFRACFTDQAERAARGRFGNEPIKIRSFLRHEPDARGVGWHVFRKRNDRLHERDGVQRVPTRSFCNAARSAVAADDCIGVNLFASAVAASLNLEHHSFRVGMKRMKATAQFHSDAGLLRFGCEALNQGATLDDEIGMLQSNRGGAAVGEKLETANFVYDATFGGAAQERAHALRNNQRARGRFERVDALEDADGNSPASQQGSGEQSCGGATNKRDARRGTLAGVQTRIRLASVNLHLRFLQLASLRLNGGKCRLAAGPDRPCPRSREPFEQLTCSRMLAKKYIPGGGLRPSRRRCETAAIQEGDEDFWSFAWRSYGAPASKNIAISAHRANIASRAYAEPVESWGTKTARAPNDAAMK